MLDLANRATGLLSGVAGRIADPRQEGKVQHDLEALLGQRVYAVALGHEDVNDHDALRGDLALQTACGRDELLASASTVGRMEQMADRSWAWAAHEAMVECFIASFKRPPKRLVLDFDATDDAVHGEQEGRFFHGYYDKYCFLPLYVFCGGRLLVSYLRPANRGEATHAWAILALLVKRLRREWPEVKIVMRGDSGFRKHRIMSWCERNGVGYILGLAKNARLKRMAAPLMGEAEARYGATGRKQRLVGEFRYGAESWGKERRVIARVEHGSKGENPRFVVTNLEGKPRALYYGLYCARGDMENRIKEQQLDLFADRTSCHRWWPNQFRLLLSSLAYTLVEAIRRLGLKGTRLARAQAGTIRLKLLRIGAIVLRNTRRVRLHLSSACPDKSLFALVAWRLKPR